MPCFRMPGERTITIDQLAKLKDPKLGYDPLLAARMEAVLAICRKNKVKIITNMGAANPAATREKTREIARALGIRGLKSGGNRR